MTHGPLALRDRTSMKIGRVALPAVLSLSLLSLPACGGSADPGPMDGSVPASCPAPTGTGTVHKGDVMANEVWTAAGSPHIVEYDVTVRDGATLTIEPCAEVQLAAGKHIEVAYPGTPNRGTLVAEGTADKPIRFVGQGGARWASLYVNAPGTARLRYVTLEGGGGGDFEDNSTVLGFGDGDLPADPVLLLDHVTIKGSQGAGLWLQRGATFMAGSQELTITGSGNDVTPYPLQIEEHAIDALPTGHYIGNRRDEILLHLAGYGVAGGGLTVDATLHDRGVPYHVGRSNSDNFIVGRTDKDGLATLTIEAGVVMKFTPGTVLKVQSLGTDKPGTGAVRALGTAERPVVFTSANDAPQAGDWRGLWFSGLAQASNQLDHVRIEYAGGDCSCILNTCSAITTHHGAIIFTAQAPGPFLTNSQIVNSAGHGITEGYDGSFVNFRPSNQFSGIAGCVQTRPRDISTQCPNPKPACD